MAEASSADCDAPRIIPIPDVKCQNCGAGLAWRVGVGRYVISHESGRDRCSSTTVFLADEDREAAALAYRKADEAFRASRVLSPVNGDTSGGGGRG